MVGGFGAKDILIQLKGDTKNFKGAMKDADKSMGSLTKSVKAYGPAMAAGLAVGTAAFMGLAVKMAAAEEVVNRQTESMLKSQGIMWDNVKGEVTGYINELERLTAYGDTDLQMAFNRMSSSGLGYKETLESLKMVTDIAYTRNIDLVAAADLVSKAYNGQGSALKRYGIIIENGVEGLEALNAVQSEVDKNFSDAADRTETLEGSMGLLTAATDDFMEALGDPLTGPLADFVDVMAEGTGEADGMATKLGAVGAWFTEEFLMPKDMMMPFRVELQKIDEMEEQTFEDRQRRNKIIYEMQYGTYRSRKALMEDIRKTGEEVSGEEDNFYFMQLRKMGATEEYIALLKEGLKIQQDTTNEEKEQLSIMEQLAAKQKEIAQARGTGGISGTDISDIDRIVAAGAGTREVRGRTITYSGNNSGAP